MFLMKMSTFVIFKYNIQRKLMIDLYSYKKCGYHRISKIPQPIKEEYL